MITINLTSYRLMYACFYLLFPYNTLDLSVSSIILNVLAVPCFLCWRSLSGNVSSTVFMAFSLITSIIVMKDFLTSSFPTWVVFSQSNHFIQYFIMSLALLPAMSDSKFQSMILGGKFRNFLTVSALITFTSMYIRDGYVHEFAPNTLFLLLSCSLGHSSNAREKLQAIITLLLVLVVFSLSGRASPLMVIGICLIIASVRIPSVLIRMGSLIVLIAPIVIYSSVDRYRLYDLLQVDHNTYIRAEFIRSAVQNLIDNLFFGVGFGPSYRPYNYDYITSHKLLSDEFFLNTVSNHHSIFDTSLRLGIPLAIALVAAIFVLSRVNDKIGYASMLIISVGMSVNAWLENQTQLPMVAVLTALIIASHNRRKIV